MAIKMRESFVDLIGGTTDNVNRWERVADPDAALPAVESSLQALVDEVKSVAQEESFILKRAFPYHELVLSKFLQRVFQQSVSHSTRLSVSFGQLAWYLML